MLTLDLEELAIQSFQAVGEASSEAVGTNARLADMSTIDTGVDTGAACTCVCTSGFPDCTAIDQGCATA